LRRPTEEPRAVRWALIALTLVIVGALILAPLFSVLAEAFSAGIGTFMRALREGEAISAIVLTVEVALIVVPLNTIFGIAAAWVISRFTFRGKNLLVTLVDLPLSVSPVIGGMIFVLLYGARGLLGPWLDARDVKIIYAFPGIVLATAFVTAPFVARELAATLAEQGRDEEEVALTLGASGWQLFRRVVLPNAKWGLLYGIVLCNARAMGEFGAVSVVSGRVRGSTDTLSLYVDALHSDLQFAASFAVASLLVVVALATLVLQQVLERTRRS
jgi:sulfate transport system permease protein